MSFEVPEDKQTEKDEKKSDGNGDANGEFCLAGKARG